MDGDGKCYSTPIQLGPASVLPLDTFLELPIHDSDNDNNSNTDIDSHFATDVDLSLTLWSSIHQ